MHKQVAWLVRALLHFDYNEVIPMAQTMKRQSTLRWFISGARTSPLIFQLDGPMQNLLPRLAIGNSQICFLCRDLRLANRNAKDHKYAGNQYIKSHNLPIPSLLLLTDKARTQWAEGRRQSAVVHSHPHVNILFGVLQDFNFNLVLSVLELGFVCLHVAQL